jgi:hypothetical protein
MKPLLWFSEFDAMFVPELWRNMLPFQTTWCQPITSGILRGGLRGFKRPPPLPPSSEVLPKLSQIPSSVEYIGCPTTYQTQQFFNNFTTNEDIAQQLGAHYRRVPLRFSPRNVLLFKSRCNIFIVFGIIKELPGLVGTGTPYTSVSQTFFKWGPLLLVRMFYGPAYSCPL